MPAGPRRPWPQPPRRLRVGLIGFGAIGQQVAEGIASGLAGDVDLVAILVRTPRAQTSSTRIVTDLAEFLATEPQIVVEAASASALAACARPILASGASLIVASSAAFVDERLRGELIAVCERSGVRIFVPGGALAGSDALSAAAVGELIEVSLNVAEPQADVHETRVIFEGAALEAARAFPTRLNVAMTAALAAQAAVSVTLAETPSANPRTIQLRAVGAFGEFFARMQPNPLPGRLSHIVALSQLAALRRLQQPIQVG